MEVYDGAVSGTPRSHHLFLSPLSYSKKRARNFCWLLKSFLIHQHHFLYELFFFYRLKRFFVLGGDQKSYRFKTQLSREFTNTFLFAVHSPDWA